MHITINGEAANWFIAVGTFLLAAATAFLARAAWRALGQLRLATDQVRVATAQLNEVRLDRHVQVFIEMGKRWEGAEMTEALQKELDYSAKSLAELFELAAEDFTLNPIRNRKRRQAEKETVVLLRVPNYFEDAAMIAKVGSLEGALVTENFGGVAKDEWRTWEPTIKLLQRDDPEAYVGFEQMAREAD